MSNPLFQHDEDTMRKDVREQYRKIIKLKEFGFINSVTCNSCSEKEEQGSILGYSQEDMEKISSQANLGLGCANPKLYAEYKKNETVLDLGCGAGFDCFLAADEVGEKGRVIGVDMMYEMISKARQIAYEQSYANVEFRLGEIEYLPIEDKSIDVVISNCVLNLSPNKRQVIKECKRVMKKGARLYFFDVVLDDSITKEQRQYLEKMKASSCIKNALTITQMKEILEEENFNAISLSLHPQSKNIIQNFDSCFSESILSLVYSVIIIAYK